MTVKVGPRSRQFSPAQEIELSSQPSASKVIDNKSSELNRYSLRGTPITYVDPTEPLAEEDWEAAQ